MWFYDKNTKIDFYKNIEINYEKHIDYINAISSILSKVESHSINDFNYLTKSMVKGVNIKKLDINPDIHPNHVLFGLIIGRIFFFPNFLPNRNANVSHIQTEKNIRYVK